MFYLVREELEEDQRLREGDPFLTEMEIGELKIINVISVYTVNDRFVETNGRAPLDRIE